MKAKVSYKDFNTGKYRVKTVEVEKNEPCLIVRKFVEATKCNKHTYITSIKCGRYIYEWLDNCLGAF